MSKQISKTNFVMLIDEDRAELFQIMFSVMANEWKGFAEAHPEDAQRLQPEIKLLVKEFSDKVHEYGWCKDDNCHA